METTLNFYLFISQIIFVIFSLFFFLLLNCLRRQLLAEIRQRVGRWIFVDGEGDQLVVLLDASQPKRRANVEAEWEKFQQLVVQFLRRQRETDGLNESHRVVGRSRPQ